MICAMPKKLTSFFAITALATLAVAQNPNPSAALDALILNEMQAEHIPGMATAIVKGGELVWAKAYGRANVANNLAISDSTSFMLASVSKLFTGTALIKLRDMGLLDLDSPINNYLPQPVNHPTHPLTKITGRMLMTHTASINDNYNMMEGYYNTGDPAISLAEVIARYFYTNGVDYHPQQNFLPNAPGTVYEYSNMGTALAGYLAEVVAQMPFDQFCTQHIFEPLCMNRTSWFLAGLDTTRVANPHVWTSGHYHTLAHYGFADYPDGQLRSNVFDLAHFMIAFLQNGEFNSQTWLPATTVSDMLTVQFPNIDNTQGLNWYTDVVYLDNGNSVPVWGHNGGETGVSTDLYINPTNGIGVVVLSNSEGDNANVIDALYNYALGLSPSGVGNPPCIASVNPTLTPAERLPFYPNPTSGKVYFNVKLSNHGTSKARVFKANGQLIGQFTIQPNNQIDLSNLASGLYHLQLIEDGVIMGQQSIMLMP